jgi:AraC-like DNA-binding protein
MKATTLQSDRTVTTYARVALAALGKERWPAASEVVGTDVSAFMVEPYLDIEHHHRLLQHLVDVLGMTRAAQLYWSRTRLSMMGPAATLVLSAPTVRDAVTNAIKITRLQSGVTINVWQDGGALWISDKPADGSMLAEIPGCWGVYAVVIVRLFCEIMQMACTDDFSDFEVHIPVPRPYEAAFTQTAVLPTLVWDSPWEGIVGKWPARVLDMPTLNGNPATYEISQQYLQNWLNTPGAPMFTPTPIETLVISEIEMLNPHIVDQELVCKRLAMSPAKLRRELAAEGTTFQDVRNQTWLKMAKQQLQYGQSKAQVADFLGKDPSNFGTWFDRQNDGQSLQEYIDTLSG